jgi:hypothetical protein
MDKRLLLSITIFLLLLAGCSQASTETPQPAPSYPAIRAFTPVSTFSSTSTPATLTLRVGGSSQNRSIQEAINSARPGVTIQVAQGTYSENLKISDSVNATILGGWDSSFSDRSDNNSLTIINGGENNSVLTINSNPGTNTELILTGITIQNGRSEDGAGICVNSWGKNSSIHLTLNNITITGNTAISRGGGIYGHAWDSGSIILELENNKITRNYSQDNGGGVDIDANQGSVNARITRNVILENGAMDIGAGIHINTSRGGIINADISKNIIRGNIVENIEAGGIGIYASGNGSTTVSLANNLIAGNKSNFGGGILGYAWGEQGTATINMNNNFIVGNTAKVGGGIFSCSGKTSPDVTEPGGLITWTLKNNTITGNTAVEFAGGIELYSGSVFGDGGAMSLSSRNDIIWGNIDNHGNRQLLLGVETGKSGSATAKISYTDIGIVDSRIEGTYIQDHVINTNPLFTNGVKEDLRLQESSPCIDAGDPDSAYNDSRRPPGKGTEQNDMGAYGGPKNFDWPE